MFKKVFTRKVISPILMIVLMITLLTQGSMAMDVSGSNIKGKPLIEGTEDYINEETGEYLIWNKDSRGLAHSFTFKIRNSVASNKFTVNSKNVNIYTSARIEDSYGNVQTKYNGHKYQINMGTFKNLHLRVGQVSSGTITGFRAGSKYSLSVINNDDFLYETGSNRHYLVGSGSVYD